MPGSNKFLWQYTSISTLANDDIIRIDQSVLAQPTPYETKHITFANFKSQVASGSGTGQTPPEVGVSFVSKGLLLGDEAWNTEIDEFLKSYWGVQGSEPAASTSNQFYFIDNSGIRPAVKITSNIQKFLPYQNEVFNQAIANEINSLTLKSTPVSADILLIEDSADGFNKKYITIGSLPGGGSSPLTTKGDIYTFDTADARLPVGADTYILSADSAEATGLKWIPQPSGIVPSPVSIGDMIWSANGASWGVLPIGTNGYVLTVVGGAPVWQPSGAGTTTYIGLTDTPGTYPASALGQNRIAKVNAAGNAMIFENQIQNLSNANVITGTTQLRHGEFYEDTADSNKLYYSTYTTLGSEPFTYPQNYQIWTANDISLIVSGGGTLFLADDGTYKAVGGSSPLTTKGDIYTRNASTDDRFPASVTDGAILQTASGQTQGLLWKEGIAKGEILVSGATGGFSSLIASTTNGQVLTIDTADGFGMKWADISYLSLADTPGTYPASALGQNRIAKVNAAGNAMVFDNQIPDTSIGGVISGGSNVRHGEFFQDTAGGKKLYFTTYTTLGSEPFTYPQNYQIWTANDVSIVTNGAGNQFLSDDGTYKAAGGAASTIVIKSTDESVTSSTTPQADNELLAAVSASSSYRFEIDVILTGTGSSTDFLYQMNVPTGTTGYYTATRVQSGGTGVDYTGETTIGDLNVAGLNTTSIPTYLKIQGYITTSTTAGNLTFYWATNISTANPTTVKAGSKLELFDA